MGAGTWLVNGVPGGGLSPNDEGFLRGLTVFETWRSYSSRPFRQEAHLARLEGSARAMGVPLPPRALLLDEIDRVTGPDHVVRVHLTAGGQRVVSGEPLDLGRVGRPLHVATLVVHPDPSLPGAVKHVSRAGWSLAARRAGADEALLVTAEGELLESSRSNVIAAVDGALVTPPADGRILEGVTRAALIEAAARAGLPLVEARLSLHAPMTELYACSTLKELAPVVAISGRPAPGAGPLGAALHRAFAALVAEECQPRV